MPVLIPIEHAVLWSAVASLERSAGNLRTAADTAATPEVAAVYLAAEQHCRADAHALRTAALDAIRPASSRKGSRS